MERERPPVELELAGKNYTIRYEDVRVHIYDTEDNVYSFISLRENESQWRRFYDVPRQILYLSGILIPNTGLSEKQAQKLGTAMFREVGWNADRYIQDYASEQVKERYRELATVALRAENVYVPQEWTNGA